MASSPAAAQDLASTLPVVVTTGEATLQRAPDLAFVTASVETRARNPRDAQRENAAAMGAVQKRLADAGISREAIRTLGYHIEQQFDYIDGRRIARDFLARNTIEVRLDDVRRAGEILDAVVQSGATTVGGVRFDLKDRAGAEREAMRMAVADARARAEAAATGAGQSIDRVIRIEDVRDGMIPPRPMLAMARSEQAQDTPIEPGVIEIHARVMFTASFK